VGLCLAGVLKSGGTVYWCGNGGSASDSQHLAAELVGQYKKDRQALRSVALNTDTSILTCVGNDLGFDQVFSRQVEALGRPGDVLVGISTSGESPNILRALEVASGLGMATVGLLGRGGGRALPLVDEAIVIPSDSTARIQECHILVGHILCEIIEEELGLV
jgi:D-sedoheptulose 7-phosphate isomerase